MKKQLISILVMLAMLVSLTVMPAVAAESLKLTVSNEKAEAGSEVKVTVSVSGNTGLASLKVDVAYDSYLTLTAIEFNSDFGTLITAPEPFKNPEPITMISPLSDITANGVFATLTFSVSEDAPAGYKAGVTLSFDENDIYDGNYENVATTVVNGGVEIDGGGADGDLNGDGSINITDLFTMKSCLTIGVSNPKADMNGDGSINITDLFMLKQILVG